MAADRTFSGPMPTSPGWWSNRAVLPASWFSGTVSWLTHTTPAANSTTANVPNNSTNGVPIALSNGNGVTDATVVLSYNADLLTISGGTVNPALSGAPTSTLG